MMTVLLLMALVMTVIPKNTATVGLILRATTAMVALKDESSGGSGGGDDHDS